MRSAFRSYPHNSDGIPDGQVISVHGFDEENNRGKLHVCKECHTSLPKRKIPEAALATDFWVGDMPRKFDGARVIERDSAYAVGVEGHAMALESRKVRNIPGSAQRSLRGTFVFYANDSCSVGQELPPTATGLLDILPFPASTIDSEHVQQTGRCWLQLLSNRT